ncbi:MAG: lysylphosphatidylglycerol synthase transmembrane domain-containing protein [Gemmatimonadota bacterium]
MAARLLTPKVLLRGFELFMLASLIGMAGLLIYGNDTGAVLDAIGRLHWGWLLVGVGLASLDWFGGGLRLWVLARQVHRPVSLKGMILAGGMGAWASYITPVNSGAGPMIIYSMRRYGIPVPVAITTTLMSFVATVAFFALAGPLAILLGAGRSLGAHGVVLGLSLYDLFLGSLGIFVGLAALLLGVMIFPRLIANGVHRLATWLGQGRPKLASKLESFRAGIDQAHESMVAFNTPKGWFNLFIATIISGPSHANKLLAGYVTLRALDIHVNFVDVLLLQTLITFLLYFAPTPGASGIAEVISAAVMSIYVPRELTPLYTIIWRCILSYFTLAFGFGVFSSWVRAGLKAIDASGSAASEPMPEPT